MLGHPIDSATDWDAIQQALNKATTAAECAEVAKKFGFNFTEQEFQDYFEEHLTPEQLEAVGAETAVARAARAASHRKIKRNLDNSWHLAVAGCFFFAERWGVAKIEKRKPPSKYEPPTDFWYSSIFTGTRCFISDQ